MANRTANRVLYFVIVFWLVFAGCAALRAAGASSWACLDLAFLVILTGYSLDALSRDVWAATLHRKAKDYVKAKLYAERFLARIKWLRWLKPVIRARSGSRRDPEAMALNCLGGAETSLREFDKARRHLEAAIKLDPKWALPYFGMGLLVLRTKNAAEAQHWFAMAQQYGYSHPTTDLIITDPAQYEANAAKIWLPVEQEKWSVFELPPADEAQAQGTTSVMVQLVNDDKTPMEFVVAALETIFGLTREAAVKVMLEVHKTGRGNCGTYPQSEAEARIVELRRRAQARGFPLECVAVPAAP